MQTITVVGYGDLTPHTSMEYTFTVIWMLLGAGFYSFTIGNISAIIEKIGQNIEIHEEFGLLDDLTSSMPDWLPD
jgi:hypothetical protein